MKIDDIDAVRRKDEALEEFFASVPRECAPKGLWRPIMAAVRAEASRPRARIEMIPGLARAEQPARSRAAAFWVQPRLRRCYEAAAAFLFIAIAASILQGHGGRGPSHDTRPAREGAKASHASEGSVLAQKIVNHTSGVHGLGVVNPALEGAEPVRPPGAPGVLSERHPRSMRPDGAAEDRPNAGSPTGPRGGVVAEPHPVAQLADPSLKTNSDDSVPIGKTPSFPDAELALDVEVEPENAVSHSTVTNGIEVESAALSPERSEPELAAAGYTSYYAASLTPGAGLSPVRLTNARPEARANAWRGNDGWGDGPAPRLAILEEVAKIPVIDPSALAPADDAGDEKLRTEAGSVIARSYSSDQLRKPYAGILQAVEEYMARQDGKVLRWEKVRPRDRSKPDYLRVTCVAPVAISTEIQRVFNSQNAPIADYRTAREKSHQSPVADDAPRQLSLANSSARGSAVRQSLEGRGGRPEFVSTPMPTGTPANTAPDSRPHKYEMKTTVSAIQFEIYCQPVELSAGVQATAVQPAMSPPK